MALAVPPANCIGEEEVWKCTKHPSRRRRNGVCATCLRERLLILCPHCAQLRPCPCVYNSTSSSSSASSSTSVGRVLDGQSALRRSRSVAIPFLRSSNKNDDQTPYNRPAKTPSFLSIFKRSSAKRSAPAEKENAGDLNLEENSNSNHRIEDFAQMITRSRSVSSAMASGGRRAAGDNMPVSKAKFWRLPTKIFRG